MLRTTVSYALLACLASPALAGDATCCSADLDGDGAVGAGDLASMLGAWGSTGPADLDGDGVVGASDLAALLGGWGPCPAFQHNPPADDPEAEQIALEILGPTGPLLPVPAEYERIKRDLALIRASTPSLADEPHSPEWAPDRLLVKVLQNVPRESYLCLNSYYGVVKEDFLFSSGGGDWYVIVFAGNVNVEALAQVYAQAPEVELAEPVGLVGGQNFWRPMDEGAGVWRWFIDDGFWDCFDGCDCHEYWTFTTDAAGTVEVVSYQRVGQPWCEWPGEK